MLNGAADQLMTWVQSAGRACLSGVRILSPHLCGFPPSALLHPHTPTPPTIKNMRVGFILLPGTGSVLGLVPVHFITAALSVAACCAQDSLNTEIEFHYSLCCA